MLREDIKNVEPEIIVGWLSENHVYERAARLEAALREMLHASRFKDIPADVRHRAEAALSNQK